MQDSDFPVDAIREAGYHATFRGMKGYNGVATLTSRATGASSCMDFMRARTTKMFESCRRSLRDPDHQHLCSARIQHPLGEVHVQAAVACAELRHYFDKHLDPQRPAVWLGDLNVAPEPIDVYHPDRRVNDVDFHIDARNAYKETVAWGFVDVFRKLHPDRVQYSYWDYFRNAFDNNWGWRIDHILATAPLADVCSKADVDMEPRKQQGASDHTVVWAEFDIDKLSH